MIYKKVKTIPTGARGLSNLAGRHNALDQHRHRVVRRGVRLGVPEGIARRDCGRAVKRLSLSHNPLCSPPYDKRM